MLPNRFFTPTDAEIHRRNQVRKEREDCLAGLVGMFRQDLERKAAVIAATNAASVDSERPKPSDFKLAAKELLGLIPGRDRYGFSSILEEYLSGSGKS